MPRRMPHSAAKLARMVLYYDAQPRLRALLPEGCAETNRRLLAAAGVLKDWHLAVYRSAWFERLAAWSDRHISPGMVLHMGLRKRFVDDEVRLGLAGGCRQVLVLGAGLDGLGARLAPRFAEALFVDVDLPGTIEVKRAALESAELAAPNLHLLGVDLGEVGLAEALASVSAWRSGTPTVVVAEGLLMYLGPAEVEDLLRVLGEVGGPGSRLVFTWLSRRADGSVDIDPLTRRSLQALGEPLRWATTGDELAALLARHGLALVADPARIDLRRRYLAGTALEGEPLARVEHVAVAEWTSPGAATSLEPVSPSPRPG